MASSTDYSMDRNTRPFFTYEPSPVGNDIFLGVFAVLTPFAVIVGIKCKSLVSATAVALGLALELIGYVGRLILLNNPTSEAGFNLFLVGTILGPNFISVAIFMTVPPVVTVYGDHFRSWRPKWYQYLLYVLTTASIILELTGGLVSTTSNTQSKADMGRQVLATGLALHLVALAIIIFHAVLFAIAVRARRHPLDTKFAGIYNSKTFKASLFAYSFATILLVIRAAFRIVVVSEGYYSSVAQSEVLLLVLDALMVLLAAAIVLACTPWRLLHQRWPRTTFPKASKTIHRRKEVPPYELPSTRSSPTYNMNPKTPMIPKNPTVIYAPRKANYSEPLPQRNLVDHEALW
ncbi:RTA1 like protein-domain-containing protein [Hypoxylon sp. FL1150]|nr:RTA1 like protein-domain-containing protein [Hypoxylon sp. FL1150]